jgi:3-oxoacyl-[acyl-carrier protein] reductase
MELRLDNRTALITGGSRGLGRAMAEAFASAGASVVVVARNLEALAETEGALVAANPGGNHAVISADVADPVALGDAHTRATNIVGPIDILVNNAGTSKAGPFLDISDEDWAQDFDLKFFAAVRLCRLCIPHMREQKWGRIINTLNTAAKAPPAKSCPTSVARAAGMAMTKALATEFAPDGVLVNALNTGLLRSNQWRTRWEKLGGHQTFDEFTTDMGTRIPLGRMGEAKEFANLALFLASDAASFITGTAINVDGGMSPVV